jgi:hypothetical protein
MEIKILNENGEVIDYDYLNIELKGKTESHDMAVGDQYVGSCLGVWEFNWNRDDFTKEQNDMIKKYVDDNWETLEKEYVEHLENSWGF